MATKTIIIKMVNGNPVDVDEPSMHLKRSLHDRVKWKTNPPNLPFTVVFLETPFPGSVFTHSSPTSPEPSHGPRIRPYKYIILGAWGASPYNPSLKIGQYLDPDVIVDA